ncbi:hypothetical protein JXO52_17350 [bacterium]|nr:hypothetical protein [bacterium]
MRRNFRTGFILKRVIIVTLLFAGTGLAQDWNATLTIDPMPSPYISDWQSDPILAMLEIENNSSEQDVVIVDLEVTDSDGNLMLRAASRRLLVLPGDPLLLNSTGYTEWNVTRLHETLKNISVRSGMFPEGDYEACVSVRNLWGSELVSQVCAWFSIRHPEPPELIYPVDDEIVSSPYPLFQWIPPRLFTAQQTVTVFRAAEILPGQLPEQALATNVPHYENFNVFDSNLEYPLDGLPLEPGVRYAWRVQAVDLEGRPATANEGRSPIGTFVYGGQEEWLTGLELILPEDGSFVETATPLFQWQPPLEATDFPPRYLLTISPLYTGQTPAEAMQYNPVHFRSNETGEETTYLYPLSAPSLQQDQQYAWQVTMTDPADLDGYEAGITSDVWTFTVNRTEQEITAALPQRLPLPSVDVAYIELTDGAGDPRVRLKTSGGAVHLFTEPGSPALLKMPGLSYGKPDIPSLPVSFDVAVDTVTWTILDGSVIAADPNGLCSVYPGGTPVSVTRLHYTDSTGVYGLFANITPSLPRSIQGAALTFTGFPVTASGFSGSASRGTWSVIHVPLPVLAETRVGSVMRMTVTGGGANFTPGSNSIRFSGDLYPDICTEPGRGPEAIHYTATFTGADLDFTTDISHLAGGTLPFAGAVFRPLNISGSTASSARGSYGDGSFALGLNGVIECRLPGKSVALTLQNIRIGSEGVVIPDTHIPPGQEQAFDLFGAQFVLKDGERDRAAITCRVDNGRIHFLLAGDMHLFGTTVPFSGFTLASDGTMEDHDLTITPFSIVKDLLYAQSIRITSGAMTIGGTISLPPPFDKQDPASLIFSISTDGRLAGNSGTIVIREGEAPGDKGVDLGLDPFFITCKPAEAEMALDLSGSACSGSVSMTINTYWPGWPNPTKIPVTAYADFSSGGEAVQWTTLADVKEYECSFAGLLRLTVKNLGVRFTDQFELVCGGNFMPDVGGVKGEGVDFSNFAIYKGGFNWGYIGGGYFNIQGFEVFISQSFLDLNPKPFEVYVSDHFTADSVSVDTKNVNPGAFCLKIGGRVKYYKAFDCGVDEVIFYVSNEEFHFVVKNAEMRIQGDMFWGNLDMEYHINSMSNLDFQILIAGDVIFDSKYRLIAAGEIRMDQRNNDYGFGLFIGAGGLNIQLGPLPIYIQDLGGGFFYRPDESIEDLVIKHCKLENTTTINKRFDVYKQHDPDLLALFLYGGISMPTNNFMHGRALITITSSHLRVDNECIFLDDPAFKKTGIDGRTTGHFQIPFSGSFYAEGNIHAFVTSKETFAKQALVTGEALAEFWAYSSDAWGIHGMSDFKIINTFDRSADFYLMPSGLFLEMGVSRDFNAGIIAVDAGLDVAAWAKWSDPQSYGGYIDAWIEAEVFWGVAGARGQLGAIIMYDDEPYFYGIANLTLDCLGYEWDGKAWAKWHQDTFSAGLGGDNELEALIAETKLIFQEMLAGTDGTSETIAETSLKEGWIANAMLSDEELDAIIGSLVTNEEARQTYYTIISDEMAPMSGFISATPSVSLNDFSTYAGWVLSLMSDPDYQSLISGTKQVGEDIILQETSVFQQNDLTRNRLDTTDYFRRTDGTDITRRPLDQSEFLQQVQRNQMETDDFSRTVIQTDIQPRNDPETLERYNIYSDNTQRIRIDDYLETLIIENRQKAVTLLAQIDVMLDSLRTLSDIEPVSNPLTVNLGGGKRSPKYFEVNDDILAGDISQSQQFMVNLQDWDRTLHQNILAIDTARVRTLRALTKTSPIAALGKSYANAASQLGDFYSFLTRPVEEEYTWYETYLAPVRNSEYDAMVNALLVDIAFSRVFTDLLDPDHPNNSELLQMVNIRVTKLREISGVNLWPDWDLLYAGYDKNQKSNLRTFWGQTGYYLLRTIPLLFGEVKTGALAEGYGELMDAYRPAAKNIYAAHTELTASTDAAWDSYADLTENLFNLYDRYLLFARQDSAGSVSANPLAAEMAVPGISGLSATVTAQPLRHSSRVDFSWQVDDPQALTETSFLIQESDATGILAKGYRAVGDTSGISLVFLPEELPVTKDEYSSLLVRVRGRSGHTSHRSLMFRPIIADMDLLSTGSAYTYIPAADNTPPSLPVISVPADDNKVIKTTGDDNSLIICYQTDNINIGIDSYDGESGIVDYQYGIGSAPDRNDIAAWRSVGGMEHIVLQGQPFTANTGKPYYIRAKAQNSARLWSRVGRSKPIYFDATPPRFPASRPVRIRWDSEAVNNTNDIRPPCSDILNQPAGSKNVTIVRRPGIAIRCPFAFDFYGKEESLPNQTKLRLEDPASYRYAFLSSRGDTLSADWQPVAVFSDQTDKYFFFTLDSIPAGAGFIAFTAINPASGLRSRCRITRIGEIKDLIPPRQPEYCIEPLASGSGGGEALRIRVFTPAADPESGIAGYRYALGTTPGGGDIRPMPDTEFDFTADTFTKDALLRITGLQVTPGTQLYYLTIKACNSEGLSAETVCGPVVFGSYPQLPLRITKIEKKRTFFLGPLRTYVTFEADIAHPECVSSIQILMGSSQSAPDLLSPVTITISPNISHISITEELRDNPESGKTYYITHRIRTISKTVSRFYSRPFRYQ